MRVPVLLCLALVPVIASFFASPHARAVERFSTYLPAEPSNLAGQSLLLDLALAGERLVAVGARGHVLLSDDYGETFRQADHVPTQATLTSVFFLNDREGWAVGHDAVIIHTTNGGETWDLQYTDVEFGEPLLTVGFAGPDKGLAMGALGLVLETASGGRHWKRRSLRSQDISDYTLGKLIAANGALYVVSEFGIVYRSADSGRTFHPVQSPATATFWSALAGPDGSLLFFGADGALWRANAGLRDWTRIAIPPDVRLSGGTVLADNRVALVGADANGAGVIAFGSASGRGNFVVIRHAGAGAYAAVAPGPRGKLVIAGEKGLRLVPDRP